MPLSQGENIGGYVNLTGFIALLHCIEQRQEAEADDEEMESEE